MTTFARVGPREGAIPLTIELKSVNARNCEVFVRAPRSFAPLEERIRKAVQKGLDRGRIEISIQIDGGQRERVAFEPDVELAHGYLEAAARLGKDLGLSGTLDLPALLGLVREAVTVREQAVDVEEIWLDLAGYLAELIDKAITMAGAEGEVLARDIRGRIGRLEEIFIQVADRAAARLAEARTALRERVRAALGDISLDEARLAQEVVIMADRLDITEEIVRARSHLAQMRGVLGEDGPMGRRLDFLLQELFREVNTAASKAADVAVSHLVVDAKAEIEKIREQVQNLV